MTRWQKGLTIAAASLTVLVLGWAVLIGSVYAMSGVISIRFHDRQNGLDVYVPLPATVVEGLVSGGVRVAGDGLDEFQAEVAEWAPTVRELLEVLDDAPDATFVEVRDGRDHVLVAKRRGAIEVTVDTDEVLVEVSAPVHMVRRTVQRVL
ncbi:MAG: hypothetical protein R2991_10135 [Thermoanaerobaculia bacterium]